MVNYVLGFAFNEDLTKVALIEKTKPEWQAGLLNGIGGKIEKYDVYTVDAMIREFKEECGIDSTYNDWQGNGYIMQGSDWQVWVYYTNTLDISKVETLTEEKVGVYDVNHILINRHLSISNIPWIISSFLDKDFRESKFSFNGVIYV